MAEAVKKRVKLGSVGLEVSAEGLGCMGMTAGYGPAKPETDMIKLIHHAINSGVTFLDTSDVYGPHTNEILIGKWIYPLRRSHSRYCGGCGPIDKFWSAHDDALKGGFREKVQLASKFGIIWKDGAMTVCGDPAYVRSCCEASLKRLEIDCIDLYYAHRIDNRVPIEATMGELKKLVEEGKIKYVGLSEASASTIRRAHAVHPITAVQTEWSMWSRDLEGEVVPTCRRKLGIGIVPYSPLGRGFFSAGAKLIESLSDDDFRKDYLEKSLGGWNKLSNLASAGFGTLHEAKVEKMPRFQPENIKTNETIFKRVSEMAIRKGCTPSQLALAWVHHQGDDVVPIPGTTKIENFNQNIEALSVKLMLEEMKELESYASFDVVKGEQHAHISSAFINSETPPLSSWKA
ncbi:hypothetical protein LguiB_012940 [Lonicera macranthoides]